jgi:hypothetical protein
MTRRVLVASLLAAAVIGGATQFSTRTAEARSALEWERSFVVQDTMLRVPVRWAPSCDANGCADSYRVTWALAPLVTADANGNAQQAVTATIVRDAVVNAPRDTATVRLPAFGQPRTLCLYVVAVRRGLASDASSACRTIERPDVAPPKVDSIRWDSLIRPPLASMPFDTASWQVEFGAYAYRDRVRFDSVAGDVVWSKDSAALRDSVETIDGREVPMVITYTNYSTQLCGTVLDTSGVPTIIVPLHASVTVEQGREYIRRCATAPRVRGRAYYTIRDTLEFYVDSVAGKPWPFPGITPPTRPGQSGDGFSFTARPRAGA